jgi:hypothetical protein
MTTRAEFRAILRGVIENATTFPDATLNLWINDAIREYSVHFPRKASDQYTNASTLVDGAYALSDSAMGVLAVEYPEGETPKRYLTRLDRRDPAFYGGEYYDVFGDVPRWVQIGIGQVVSGETMRVYSNYIHTIPSADGSTLTVPDPHLELLMAYVLYLAAKAREVEASRTLGVDGLIDIASVSMMAQRMWRQWQDKLKMFMAEASPGVWAGPWVMDKWTGDY